MLRCISTLLVALFLISCTSPPKSSRSDAALDAAGVKIDAQAAVLNCVTPHEVFTFPPQPIPGVPAILSRHGECMGSTNIVVVIWPQAPNRVNLLYVKMLVESYLLHLKKSNELYSANLVAVDTVKLEEDDTAQTSEIVTSAAVFKLVHLQEKEEK